MNNDMTLQEVMATSLMQYNQSKNVAIQHKEAFIEKFCDKKIVFYCNGLLKYGHAQAVASTLEKMKSTQPEHLEAIEASITDLKAEQHASELTTIGKAQAEAKSDDEEQDASIQLKESCEFIPNEIIANVKHNLTVKSEMQEFRPEHHAISNAILALNITRFEDLNATNVSPSQPAEQ